MPVESPSFGSFYLFHSFLQLEKFLHLCYHKKFIKHSSSNFVSYYPSPTEKIASKPKSIYWFILAPKKKGAERIWTTGLTICSRPLYRWATAPLHIQQQKITFIKLQLPSFITCPSTKAFHETYFQRSLKTQFLCFGKYFIVYHLGQIFGSSIFSLVNRIYYLAQRQPQGWPTWNSSTWSRFL
jgi:hypothetical protein